MIFSYIGPLITEEKPRLTDPHPKSAILKHAGGDATAAYNAVHAPSVLSENLSPSKHVGLLDATTVPSSRSREQDPPIPDLKPTKPPLATLLSYHDFERTAETHLSDKAWAFYSSAATDLHTHRSNSKLLKSVLFRPRLLRNVAHVSTSSTLLGCPVRSPIFVSPAAMAKLAHPDGEVAIAKAAAAKGIVQCVSNNASFSIKDIASATPPGHPLFFQLYVNRSREKTAALVAELRDPHANPVRALFLTIDAPVPGKREADERLKSSENHSLPNSGASSPAGKDDAKGGGLGRIMGSYIDDSLCWEDVAWVKAQLPRTMPLVIKGIQSAADALLAVENGAQGIVVSNHGGRGLDGSPPAVLTLLELRRCCPEVFDRVEVLVDGGVKRGADVLKCICLGAKGVGVGRGFLYAVLYGQSGVERFVDVLQDELVTSMKLVGVTDLTQANSEYVNTGAVQHLVPGLSKEGLRAKI